MATGGSGFLIDTSLDLALPGWYSKFVFILPEQSSLSRSCFFLWEIAENNQRITTTIWETQTLLFIRLCGKTWEGLKSLTLDEFEALDKPNQKTHKNCRLLPEWLSSTLRGYPSYPVNSRYTPVIHYHLTIPQLASTLWVYSSYLAPYECTPTAELGDL